MDNDMRVTLRLPARLREPLKALADREHRSMHGQIVKAIEDMLERAKRAEGGGAEDRP
jgi:predicted transcriptional regulator